MLLAFLGLGLVEALLGWRMHQLQKYIKDWRTQQTVQNVIPQSQGHPTE